MGVYKRGDTYWYKFLFQGQLIRESARTNSKTVAREAERARRRDLELAINRISRREQTPLFSVAAENWLKTKRVRSRFTELHYRHYVDMLCRHFGKRLVCDINVEDISALQALRQNEGLSGRSVNAETGVLRQILKHHNLWALMSDRVRFLRERRDVGRAISEEDEAKLLAAIRGSRSPSLLPLFVVSIDSGLRASELRNLRRRDLHLAWAEGVIQSGEIVVSHSKTEGGAGRTVPLTRRSCAELTLWLSRFEGAQSDSHIFPKHQVGFAGHQRRPCLYNIDLTRPMAEWNSAWEAARRAAGVDYRWHDLRHTFISRLAENPRVSEQTITALAGHVSKRMLERYSHIRAQAKRDAISMLEAARGWAQNRAQSRPDALLTDSEKPDKSLDLLNYTLERVIGFEPTTLCLASTRSTN
jgi:integrase